MIAATAAAELSQICETELKNDEPWSCKYRPTLQLRRERARPYKSSFRSAQCSQCKDTEQDTSRPLVTKVGTSSATRRRVSASERCRE